MCVHEHESIVFKLCPVSCDPLHENFEKKRIKNRRVVEETSTRNSNKYLKDMI